MDKRIQMTGKVVFPVVSEDWGNDSFKIKDNRVVIHNGRAFYNLPLHCPGSRTLMLSGSKPMLLLHNDNVLPEKNVKFGELAIKISVNNRNTKWLHEFDTITTTYDTGRVSYLLRDKQLNGFLFQLDVVPLVSAEGVMVRLRIRKKISNKNKIKLIWIYGGMVSCPGLYGPWNAGKRRRIHPKAEDCQLNHIGIKNDRFYLAKKGLKNVIVCGETSYHGDYRISEAIPGKKGYPMISHCAEILIEDRKLFEGYIAISWGKRDSVELIVDKVINSNKKEYQDSVNYSENIANSICINTPDKLLNAGIKYTNYSADACWRPPSFLHASVIWTDWYTGWRDLYGPTVCGWHNRVRSALEFQSRHTNSPDKFPRDEKMDRLENAYIDPSRRATGRIHMSTSPITGDAAGHHDCDQLFVDFLYHHFCWSGDTELVRELWPVLAQAVEFQRITRDPDDDGLYVNVLNTWISDSHEYHQGACTVQSAYLWKNNMEMAEMAKVLGKDSKPYEQEAAKIKKAMMENLWLNEKGIFAEYRDVLGIIHPSPESTSIYHPIEFGLTDMFQTYRMLKYARENLLNEDGLISPSQWLPTGRCCHKTPFVCETLNMALAAYVISENEMAFKMLQGSFDTYDKEGIVRSGVYIPLNPQNDTGDIDMLDNASLFQRVIVEGLFGIKPQVQEKTVTITPNFPSEWKNAGIETPDIKYRFNKNSGKIVIRIETSLPLQKRVRFPLKREKVLQVTLNGKEVSFNYTSGIGHYYLEVNIPSGYGEDTIVVKYQFQPIKLKCRCDYKQNEVIEIEGSGCKILGIIDPQNCISKVRISPKKESLKGKLICRPGKHVVFIKIESHNRIFYEPLEFEVKKTIEKTAKIMKWQPPLKSSSPTLELKKRSIFIPLDKECNGKLADIFDRIPPEVRYGYDVKEDRKMDDSYLREKVTRGIFTSDMGIQFRLSQKKHNAVYIISKPVKNLFVQGWLTLQGADRFYKAKYPSSVRIPIGMKGIEKVYLMFLGSTSWMQSYVPAVRITMGYEKGKKEIIELSNPESFDFFMEHASCHFGQPLTEHVEPWSYSDYTGYKKQEHADIAGIFIYPNRKLEYIELSVIALDTTMALLGLTLLLKK